MNEKMKKKKAIVKGGLAQMVERPLSMREAPGSIPGFSTFTLEIGKDHHNKVNFFRLEFIPTIAQLVERRTVVLIVILRSLVRIRLVGLFIYL